jgi:hypothetical protein
MSFLELTGLSDELVLVNVGEIEAILTEGGITKVVLIFGKTILVKDEPREIANKLSGADPGLITL